MRTPNIFISTNVNDFHAAAVYCALKRVGANPILWFNSDHPTHAATSWKIDRGCLSVLDHARNDRVAVDLGEIDSFWHRRPALPTIKKGILNPADEQSAFECTREFLRGIHRYLDSHAFAVNNTLAAEACENKMVQLAAAIEVGFNVPDTLISNDAREIQGFIARRKPGHTIFKPLRPTVWRNGDVSAVSYTTAVTLNDLPRDTVLEMAPGIVQERIEKLFELRVTCIGNEVVAVRLMSQEHVDARYDFRGVDPYKLKTEPFKLPPAVEERCRKLMRQLNLRFGAMDLIWRPDGEVTFLEVNQMGQFLWLERLCPEVRLLDTFVQFLMSKSDDFLRGDADLGLRLKDFEEEAAALVEKEFMPPKRQSPRCRTVMEAIPQV